MRYYPWSLLFLLTEQAQAIYADINHELPIRQDIKASGLVGSWGNIKGDINSVQQLYSHLAIADSIIADTSW